MSDSWPRRRLLAILRGATEPLDAQELARITGQHVTTVRFHLDVLTRESLVRQFQQPPRGRGRPRIGYRAVQRSVGYQELAQVLADHLGPDPLSRSAAAIEAGRAWGRRMDIGSHQVETLADARDITMSLMSELGFAPEKDPVGETDEHVGINLTACPLRELARSHAEVVCGVHVGLMREVLERNGARGRVEVRLHPFTEPELCHARLELTLGAEAVEHAAEEHGERPARPAIGADQAAQRMITPSGPRVPPQLRDTDADVFEQPAQQW
ncbi:helix-turn-helix transcriptional regulator [Nocardia sp. JW2]|uniref:helix-turn-helix transcriptional regulator n=1 Tax=Nocardia sp. JW2 TaxID=3450738 RepID=UPI003F41E08F